MRENYKKKKKKTKVEQEVYQSPLTRCIIKQGFKKVHNSIAQG